LHNSTIIAIFWACTFIIIYTYIGYGFLIFLLNKIKPKAEFKIQEELPGITIVVPCFNEESIIEEKIRNTFELTYPKDKIQYIFISDGSTDSTSAYIKKHLEILLLHKEERNGKSAAENRAMEYVEKEIVLFCDANAMFNKDALLHVAKYFKSKKVGGVSGEKRLLLNANDGVIESEGLYWKYESFLKQQDSDLYTVVGAAGELFAMRSALYEHMPNDTINDDLTQSLSVNLKGYRVLYTSDAYAYERPSDNVKEEKKRKIRMVAGAWQTMVRMPEIFNIIKHPLLAFQFISHRALRWTLCPIALVLVFISNILIVLNHTYVDIYGLTICIQLVFYGFALLGYIFRNSTFNLKLFNFSYYFIFMNYCAYLGFIRFIKGGQSVKWDRSVRKTQ
jgi:biofilm PGA synthesis N-glycosyltransferase PgaC